MRPAILLATAILLLASCQKTLLDDEPGSTGTGSVALPQGTGAGTEQCPYSVTDLLQGRVPTDNGAVWVAGYAVGATYRTLSAADFSPTVPYAGNVLLSADSLCHDASLCIPVELASSKWQTLFGLPHNPQGYRQCLLVQGVPMTYYKHNGLRRVSAGRWLYGFDLGSVSRNPEEWDIDSIF